MADEEQARRSDTHIVSADELRRHAEELIDQLSASAADPVSQADVAAIVHELRVHQIELEMQNEELRTAQFELDEQRDKYFELFDLAPVGYVTVSAEGMVVNANLTATRLLGVERQMLVGKPFSAFVHAADRDGYYLLLRHVAETGASQVCELQLQRVTPGSGGSADTASFWARVESRSRPASKDGSASVWLTFTDVDETVRETQALRESEERFSALFEKAPLGYQSLDEDGTFIEVNPAWLAILGYERNEVIGRWFGDFLAPEFVDGFRERFPKFKARGAIHSEFQMLRKDGVPRTIAFEGRIGRNPDGSFKQTHCILADITEREAAQAALVESEERYRFLFERSVVAQSMTSLAGELHVNPAFCKMLGYTEHELANSTTWMSLTHPDDIAENRRLLDAILAGEQDSVRFEKRYFHKEGHIIWVEVGTTLRRDDQGEPLYFMTTMVDITDRKQAEEALRESEDKYRYLWDSSVVAKSLTRPSGHVDVNDAFCKMLGYTREELADQATWMQLTHPDDVAESRRQMDALLSGEQESARFEKRFMQKSGDVIWVDLSTSLRRDTAGEPMYFMTSMVDITSQKRVSEELRRTEELHRAVLETTIDGYWLVSEDGRSLECNDAYCAMLGYTQQELLSMKVDDIEAVESPDDVAAHMRQIAAVGEARFESLHTRKDGSTVDVEVSVSALPVGSDLMFVSFVRDITARKRAEQQIAEREARFRVLTEFSPVGIYLTAPDGGCTYANPAWLKMAGMSEPEALGQGWVSGLHPDDRDTVYANWNRMVESDGEWGMEYRFVNAEDEVTWVYGTATAQRDEDGTPIRYIGANLDVTERRRAEEAMRESEAQKSAALSKYRTITESISDVVWVLDPETLRFLYVSPSVEKLRGYTPEEILAEPMDAAATPEASDWLKRLNAERLRTSCRAKNPRVAHTLKKSSKRARTAPGCGPKSSPAIT